MKSFALLALAATSAIPSVLAHGYVDKIIVKGSSGSKTYNGPQPWSDSNNFVIRRVDNTNPNHIDDGDNLACGKGAATRGAKLTGNANPGDTLSFNWNAGDGEPWPHDSGPLITYMAKCNGDCSSFDATQGKWFKIDEIGKTKTPGNEWYQDTILRQGKMYDVKLPDDLPSGNYLVRHEIIALHLADQLKGAEFYPSCSQFTVGGSNTGTPSKTVSFPGAYNENDPGIHINIWDKTGTYPFPGPDIATFSGSSSSSSGSNSTSSSSNNNSSVSNSSSDDNSDDNSSSNDGNSNDANDDSGNDSNSEDDGCDDGGDDTNDDSAASGTNDDANDSGDNNDSGDDGCDDGVTTASTTQDGNVVYTTVTVTKTVTVTPSATARVRLARETSSAPRRSRMHRQKKHSS